MKSSTVAAISRRLREKEVIRLVAVPNYFSLGQIPIAVYCSVIEQAEQRRLLIDEILRSAEIVYSSELLGQYHFLFTFLVSSLSDTRCVLRNLFQSRGDIFTARLVAPRVEAMFLPRKFIAPWLATEAPLVADAKDSKPYHADELDLRILDQICNAGFSSQRNLAHTLGEPSSTVERRVKKLQDNGVLLGFRYMVDKSFLNTHHARLLISIKGFCASAQDQLRDFATKHPNVTMLLGSIGNWDYELGIEVARLDQIGGVVAELHRLCGLRIAHIEVVTELRELHHRALPAATLARLAKRSWKQGD